MSRISIPAVAAATGATAELFQRVRKLSGRVPNTYAAIGALQPAALRAILEAEAVLAASSLGRQEVETVKLAVSAASGSDCCVAAHSLLAKLAGVPASAIRSIREARATIRYPLASFARSLVTTGGTISDAQFLAIKSAGVTDRQLVEISLAAALVTFTNLFNRINDTNVDFPRVIRAAFRARPCSSRRRPRRKPS
jgi:AhpD family alkylhydroperoxidase